MVLHRILLGDHLHEPKPHEHVEADITDLVHLDPDAIHDNVADEIHSIAVAVASLADTDAFVLEVAGSAWAKARVPWSVFVSEMAAGLGGPFLPLSAGVGFPLTDDLHLEGDLVLDADQKIHGASGHELAFYRSLDDSNNFGNVDDVARVFGSGLRPVYQQNLGVDKEIALLDDLTSSGLYVEISGDTMTGDLIMDWGTVIQVDVGVMETPTDALQGNSFGIVFGDASAAAQILGSLTRPTYNGADIALVTDIGGGPSGIFVLRDGTTPLTANWDAGPYEIRARTLESDIATGTAPLTIASTTVVTSLNADLLDGEHASAFADASHVHAVYLTETEADLLYSLLGHTHPYAPVSHTHTESEITDFDSGDYLPLAGGNMSGDINFEDDSTGIRFWDDDSDYKRGLSIMDNQLVVGDDLTSGDAWEIWLKSNHVYMGYGSNDSNMYMWDDNSSSFRTVAELVSGGDFRVGTSNHDINIQGNAYRPNYEGNELALLSDTNKSAFPIFACSSTAEQSLSSSDASIEWEETPGRRVDSGYTHDTGTNPDEITLDEVGWYLIIYDIGIIDDSSDGQTRYSSVLEFWDGAAWEHTANDGGYEAENRTYTEGGSGGPQKAVITGHTLWHQNEGANTKIRLRVSRSTTASSPNISTDDECCRIYIEKKSDA